MRIINTSKIKLWLFAIVTMLFTLSFSSVLHAQDTVTVSGTIVDSDGSTWINGTWTALLINSYNGVQPTYIDTGLPVSVGYAGNLGATTGAFSQVIPNNNAINPVNTQWQFTFCPWASFKCTTIPPVSITGAFNISSLATANILPPRISPGPQAYGYADVNVITPPQVGSIYYNVTSQCQRLYNGTSWSCNGGAGSSPFQSLTTTGTSGASTLTSGVLNIPIYSSGGGGGGNTTSTALTTNHLSMANGANSIVDSSVTDDGTSVAVPRSAEIMQFGNIYNVDGFPDSCTVATVAYTTRLDCAYATAKNWTNTYNLNSVVILGTGCFVPVTGSCGRGVYYTNVGLISPTNGFTVSVLGNDRHSVAIDLGTTTGSVTLTTPTIFTSITTGGNPGSIMLRGFTLNTQGNAQNSSVNGIEFTGLGYFWLQDISIRDPNSTTTGAALKFGCQQTDSECSSGPTYYPVRDGYINEIQIDNTPYTNSGTYKGPGLTLTVASGHATGCSVNSGQGGTGVESTWVPYFLNVPSGATAPTGHFTISGGTITACTIDTQGSGLIANTTIWGGRPAFANYIVDFNNITDSRYIGFMFVQGTAKNAYIRVAGGSSFPSGGADGNMFIGIHPSAGGASPGILGFDIYGGGNEYLDTECDSLGGCMRFHYSASQSSIVEHTHLTWNYTPSFAYPGISVYDFYSANTTNPMISISDGLCDKNTDVLYNQYTTNGGNPLSITAANPYATVRNDPNCNTLQANGFGYTVDTSQANQTFFTGPVDTSAAPMNIASTFTSGGNTFTLPTTTGTVALTNTNLITGWFNGTCNQSGTLAYLYPLGASSTTCSTATIGYSTNAYATKAGVLSNFQVKCNTLPTATTGVFTIYYITANASIGQTSPSSTGITLSYNTTQFPSLVANMTETATGTYPYSAGTAFVVRATTAGTSETMAFCLVSFNMGN